MSQSSGEGEPEVGFGAGHHHHLLYTNPVSVSQPGSRKDIFQQRNPGWENENKTVGLVWCKNNEEPE